MKIMSQNMYCPLDDDWINYRDKLKVLAGKVEEMHTNTEVLKAHASHLQKLDKLEIIADSISLMKDKLLDKATTRDDRATYVMGGVIFVLVLIIGFLLTGETTGLIGALHR